MSGGCADSGAVSTAGADAAEHSRAGDQDRTGRTRFALVLKTRPCGDLRSKSVTGCGQENTHFVIPTDVTKEVKELWRLTGPTGRFNSWPVPRSHPGEYYQGLRHWNPEAPLPQHNATLSAEEYAQGSNTCARPYTWCGTCLPEFGHMVFADPPLQAKQLADHEKTPAHRFSFLYNKIMSSSATPEERAQFAELEVSKERYFKEANARQVVNAACERVFADALINPNGDVSPGESVGSAQVVSSRCAFAVRNW